METKIQDFKNAFNRNREANIKALLLCCEIADKAAFVKDAMNYMTSEAGMKAAFRINGYSWDFASDPKMIDICEEASATIDTTPMTAAEIADNKRGMHEYGSKFRNVNR
jgi:hypothetical protein